MVNVLGLMPSSGKRVCSLGSPCLLSGPRCARDPGPTRAWMAHLLTGYRCGQQMPSRYDGNADPCPKGRQRSSRILTWRRTHADRRPCLACVNT